MRRHTDEEEIVEIFKKLFTIVFTVDNALGGNTFCLKDIPIEEDSWLSIKIIEHFLRVNQMTLAKYMTGYMKNVLRNGVYHYMSRSQISYVKEMYQIFGRRPIRGTGKTLSATDQSH